MSIGETSTDNPAFGDSALAREMFVRMTFIRAFEAKALSLSQSNPPLVMGSMHLCAGQEAVPLGAIAALRADDQIIATYRGHGWAIAAGLDPLSIMAEICHRKSGLNGGRGGSAYFMAPQSRFIGENSIVGAGTTIACGVAMANLHFRTDRIVVVSIGDGAMNQGAVHEAMAFAAVRKLPVIFICENNGWSELTPTKEMFRIDRLAQRGAGYGINSATIAGTDPIVIRNSVALAANHCREGKGPVLIECRVSRLWGHYNRDIEHYRPKSDRLEAEAQDPIALIEKRLVSEGLMTTAEASAMRSKQETLVDQITQDALASATPDRASALSHVIAVAPQYKNWIEPTGEVKEMTYIEAVNAALRTELEAEGATVVYGEDIGKAGGIFGETRNLQREFGPERVFDTPIAENAILGSALGAALCGLKPIVEIMWADFIFVALDQLINQAANIRYVTEGRTSAPIVIRTQQGATPGSCPQHSQSIEAILAHIPGLKVALAATPQDAFALLRSAAADRDPCIVIEARSLYQVRGPVYLDAAVEPVGQARLYGDGTDAAIIAWGTMVPRALEAARKLQDHGQDVSVLDLRWLSPVDDIALASIARKTEGRIIVTHEAVRSGGFGAEIVTRLQELCPDITFKIRRITTPDVRIPASPVLQAALIPSAADIVDSVLGLLKHRSGQEVSPALA